jgi:acetylglutamate synthase
MKTKSKIIVITLIVLAGFSTVNAQKKITLSGAISCSEEEKSPLSFVNIYNVNTKRGTISDSEGKFKIKMGMNDTILFSTVQHLEQIYTIKKGDLFEDKSIEIDMVKDTVWLKVVSIMGFKEFDEFKKEVLELNLPQRDISMALPVVDKYAKQHKTGEGALELREPLIYLLKKFNLAGRKNGKKR